MFVLPFIRAQSNMFPYDYNIARNRIANVTFACLSLVAHTNEGKTRMHPIAKIGGILRAGTTFINRTKIP